MFIFIRRMHAKALGIIISGHILASGVLIQPNVLAAQKTKCHTIDIDFKWGKRKPSSFKTSLSISPSNNVISNCIKLNGISSSVTLTSKDNVKISINDRKFTTFPVTLFNHDKIRLITTTANRFAYNKTFSVIILGDNKDLPLQRTGLITWTVQTTNRERPPKKWYVGPSFAMKQLAELKKNLVAGDEIFLEGNSTYEPVDFKNISGTKKLPIMLHGFPVKGKRPIISGGTKRFNWTFSLRNSHYWKIDNIILENGGICYRHESAYIELSKILIRHCGHGILGTDNNSGSLHISQLELTDSGGKQKNTNWKHGIYMATDRDRFPQSVFSIVRSFLHHNKGNAIKSRAERAEIYGNWIENDTDKQSIYAIELVGYDGYEAINPINHDIVGNVISLKNKTYGFRVGGDGTGFSDGFTRFSSNIILVNDMFNSYLYRITGKMRSLTINNNIFLAKGSTVNLVKDSIDPQNWHNGYPTINITNNFFSTKFQEYISKNDGLIDDFSQQYKNIVIKNNKYIPEQQYNFLYNKNRITLEAMLLLTSRKASPKKPSVFKHKLFDPLFNPYFFERPIPGKIPYQ